MRGFAQQRGHSPSSACYALSTDASRPRALARTRFRPRSASSAAGGSRTVRPRVWLAAARYGGRLEQCRKTERGGKRNHPNDVPDEVRTTARNACGHLPQKTRVPELELMGQPCLRGQRIEEMRVQIANRRGALHAGGAKIGLRAVSLAEIEPPDDFAWRCACGWKGRREGLDRLAVSERTLGAGFRPAPSRPVSTQLRAHRALFLRVSLPKASTTIGRAPAN
jgi:hypothetical protein